MDTKPSSQEFGLFSLPVVVAALGYFVDIYDLTVFSLIRTKSLQEFGLSPDEISKVGSFLMNCQLAGIVLGGILWGLIGDKYGRRTILFGSILTYSIANIANGFVSDMTTYSILRFIAGLGLAGELGAGITLIAEILKKEQRSYATSLVTGFGLLGVLAAYLTFKLSGWRATFFVGGGLGLFLLLVRYKVLESSLFLKNIKNNTSNIFSALITLFKKKRILTLLWCIGVAIPIYLFFGLFAAYGNEIGVAIGLTAPDVSKCVVIYYTGLAIGDFFSGPLSHILQSRKKVIGSMITLTLVFSLIPFIGIITTTFSYYVVCFLGGLVTGYWAMFVITTSESFGTDVRATVTTSAPNFVRGSLILIYLVWQPLKSMTNVIQSTVIISIIVFVFAFFSLYKLKETFNKDLDYNEN